MNNEEALKDSKCLVCGYDLGESIIDATAHNVICPSCGIQYGYTDMAGGDAEKRPLIYKYWYEAWIANNMKPIYTKEIQREIIARARNTKEV